MNASFEEAVVMSSTAFERAAEGQIVQPLKLHDLPRPSRGERARGAELAALGSQ